MARPRRVWPNAEKYVRQWLIAQTGRQVYTETDGTLTGSPPCYQIARVGGSDRSQFDKRILIEVDSIAGKRGDAWDAAAAAQTAMEYLAANGDNQWYVDDVEEVFAPAVEPYENSGVRRITATYGLTVRPRAVTDPTP